MDLLYRYRYIFPSTYLSPYSRYSDVIDHSDPEDEDEDEEEVVEDSETGDTGGDEGGGEGGVGGGAVAVERQMSEVAGSPCLLKPSTPTIKTQKTIRKVKLNLIPWAGFLKTFSKTFFLKLFPIVVPLLAIHCLCAHSPFYAPCVLP